MAEEKCDCDCNTNPTLIFEGSVTSEIGTLTDRATRPLTLEGVGRMYCLAGWGRCVKPIIQTTGQAGRIIAIDGYPLVCAINTLKTAGFTNFTPSR
jgi:uncharacterized metal-binding protein